MLLVVCIRNLARATSQGRIRWMAQEDGLYTASVGRARVCLNWAPAFSSVEETSIDAQGFQITIAMERFYCVWHTPAAVQCASLLSRIDRKWARHFRSVTGWERAMAEKLSRGRGPICGNIDMSGDHEELLRVLLCLTKDKVLRWRRARRHESTGPGVFEGYLCKTPDGSELLLELIDVVSHPRGARIPFAQLQVNGASVPAAAGTPAMHLVEQILACVSRSRAAQLRRRERTLRKLREVLETV